MSEETKDVEVTEEVELEVEVTKTETKKKGKSKKGKSKDKKSVDVGAIADKAKDAGSSILSIVKNLFLPDIPQFLLHFWFQYPGQIPVEGPFHLYHSSVVLSLITDFNAAIVSSLPPLLSISTTQWSR